MCGFALTPLVKCDKAGNVYAGCGDGLHIWSECERRARLSETLIVVAGPHGTLLGKM